MTTIAYDGRIIAADGLRLWGSDIVSTSEQKIRPLYIGEPSSKRLYALAGYAGLTSAFPAIELWYLEGAQFGAAPKVEIEGWDALFVGKGRSAELATSAMQGVVRIAPPIAIGAGGELAIGAMLAGASAYDAVQLICERTNHSGGKVWAYDVGQSMAAGKLIDHVS